MPRYSNQYRGTSRKKKTYRCGRIIFTKNGTIQTIDLKNGGGTRYCLWYYAKMTFRDVHQQLLKVYNLDNNQHHQTYLYDFERRRIHLSQYRTFRDYIYRYGLHGNSIVVYLCTHEDNNLPRTMAAVEEQRNLPPPPPSPSLPEYSFENSINDLMKNIRELIDQNRFHQILVQLYERICVIYGYIFGIIIPLQRNNQLSFCSDNLNNIHQIFESTRLLFYQNRGNFHHIPLFSTVFNSFCQLHNNVETLRNRYLRNMENMQNSTSDDHIEIIRVESVSPINLTNEETYSLLRSLWKQFSDLSPLIQSRCSTTCYELIVSSIEKLDSIQSNLNLSDTSSIHANINTITSIRNQFKREFNEQDFLSPKTRYDLRLFNSCRYILITSRKLLRLLEDFVK